MPLRRRFRLLRRFRRDAAGATAVEFGLVAMPFFALLFAILETALTFWTTQVMETAVADASRQIYTGQFQNDTASASAAELPGKFRDKFCERIVALIDCSQVKVDVRTYAVLPSKPPPVVVEDPVTKEKKIDPSFGAYQKPGPKQYVIVRAAVEYPVFVSLLNPNQANLTNGKRLIMGVAAFQTEPFSQ